MDIELQTCTCKRCGRSWIPRISNPILCPNPKCRSAYWNKDKKAVIIPIIKERVDGTILDGILADSVHMASTTKTPDTSHAKEIDDKLKKIFCVEV